MWANYLKALTRSNCLSNKFKLLTYARHSLSTNENLIEIKDDLNIKKASSKPKAAQNVNYFKRIAQNVDSNTRSIEDIDFQHSTAEERVYSQKYVQDSNEFARDVLKFPHKPKFFDYPTKVHRTKMKKLAQNHQSVPRQEVIDAKQDLYNTIKEIEFTEDLDDSDPKEFHNINAAENEEEIVESVPRDWEQELNKINVEKLQLKSQKRQFNAEKQAHMKELNHERNQEISEPEAYRFNKKHYRESRLKEGREDFKKKFIDFNAEVN